MLVKFGNYIFQTNSITALFQRSALFVIARITVYYEK